MPIIVPTSSGSLKKQRLVDEISGPTGPQGPAGAEGTPGATGPRGNTGIQGNPGATGPVGVTGLQGSTGIQGAQGSQGATGIRGITGLQGIQGVQGDTGIQGKTGLGGAQGATGPIGTTGFQGPTGSQGVQGVQGSTGNTGPQGLTGLIGVTGSQGSTGIKGETGVQGLTGLRGATGVQGITGIQGAQGNQGITGATGIQGVQGLQGNTGVQGIQGNQGNTGSQGLTGIQGIQGAQGNQGNTGLQGITGQQGIQGAIGPQGSTGSTGIQGVQGNAGVTGAQGVQGIQGNTGVQGVQGIQGIQGIQGPTGATGAQGAAGNPGITGAQGPTGLLGDSLAHHVQIIAGGWLKTGTGTKDVDLTGWQFDNDEFVGQNAGIDQFVLDRATGKATWAAGKGVLDARGIVQNIGGNLLLSTPYGGIGSTQNYLSSPEDFTQWNGTGATVTANDTTSPANDVTADKIVFTSEGTLSYEVLEGSFVTTDQFVFSVWLKASGSINAKLRIDGSISDHTETTFALTTLWQRFEVAVTTSNTPYPITVWIKDNGSGSTIWAWGAQLEKNVSTATVYSDRRQSNRIYGASFKNLQASNPTLEWSNGSLLYGVTGIDISGPRIDISGKSIYFKTLASAYETISFKNANDQVLLYLDAENVRMGVGRVPIWAKFELAQTSGSVEQAFTIFDNETNGKFMIYTDGTFYMTAVPSTAVSTHRSSPGPTMSITQWNGSASVTRDSLNIYAQTFGADDGGGAFWFRNASRSTVPFAIAFGTYGQVGIGYEWVNDATKSYGKLFVNNTQDYPIATFMQHSTQTDDSIRVVNSSNVELFTVGRYGNIVVNTSASNTSSIQAFTKNNYDVIRYHDQGSNLLYRQTYDGSSMLMYPSTNSYYELGARYFSIRSGGGVGGVIISDGTRLYLDTGSNSPYVALNLGAMSYATAGVTLGSQYGPSIITFAWNGSNGHTLSSTSYMKQTQLSATNGDAKLEFMNNSFDPMLSLNFLTKYVGLSNTNPSALLHPILTNATTSAIDTIAIFGHQSSGTPVNGFGLKVIFQLKSNGADNQPSGEISTSWVDASNSTRKGKLTIGAYDTAFREAITVSASGSLAKIGFFGESPALRGTLATYSSDPENTPYEAADPEKDYLAKLDDLNSLRVAYESLRISYGDLHDKLISSTLVDGNLLGNID